MLYDEAGEKHKIRNFTPETIWDELEPTFQPGWNIAEESDREFTDVVQIRLADFNHSEDPIVYEMHNTGDVTYCYGTGAYFEVEIFHNGAWHKMHYEPAWDVTAEEPFLKPGETREYYGADKLRELSPGTYRFIKEIYEEHNYTDVLYICCEFVVA